MFFNPVTISNFVLSHIGAGVIESFTERSELARKAALWYEFSRKEALEAFDWGFARKRAALALHSDYPPEGRWSFRYQYPADCLKAREIQNPFGTKANAIPFSIERATSSPVKTILTDAEDAVLVYTFDLEDTSLFSNYFIDALSHLIASRLAPPITGNHKDVKEYEFQVYVAMLRVAAAHDANENVDDEPRDPDWIRTRSYSPSYDSDTPIIRTLP
jgi:hypothetical protein